MKILPIFFLTSLFSFNLFAQITQTKKKVAPISIPTPIEIKFGSVAIDVPTEMIKRLTPLISYLNRKTGYNISLHTSANMTAAIDTIGANTTQIAYLTPAAYVEAHEKYKVKPLVSFLQNGKGNFKLVIVVKKNSSIKTINDLKGKKFAFGDKKAKLQPAIVIKGGISLGDFSSYEYLYHNDSIAKAVISGEYDGGILTEAAAGKYIKQGLKIIHVSASLPPHVIAINDQLDPEISLKLKNVFLALNSKNPKEKAIISAFDPTYDGFQEANNKDYDAVRTLISLVK